MYTELRNAGIEVVLITACPGDNKAKVLEKEGVELKMKLLDGQAWVKDAATQQFEGYMVEGLGDFWTTRWIELYPGGYGEYEMVQPALVLLDAGGKLVPECSWSWKTMGRKAGKTYTNELDRIPTGRCCPHSMLLVAARPLMEDLIPSIQEKRTVSLAPANPTGGPLIFFWCCNNVCCCCVCLPPPK